MYRAHLERLVRTRLEEVLLDEGVLPRDRVESAQLEQDQSGRLLSDVLVDAEMMDEWDLAKLICGRFGLPFLDVKGYTLRREVTELVPREWCQRHGVLPLDQFGQTLMLACQEIPTADAVRELQEMTGCSPFLYVGLRRSIREALDVPARKPAPAPKAAKPAAAPAGPAKAEAAAEAKSEAAAAPSIEPAPPTRTLDLPPLDLPAVSMRLDASASSVGVQDPKKPAIQRFQRTIGAGESSTGEAGSAATAEKPAAAGRKSNPTPSPSPAAPAAAGGPRLASRAAPVVPRGPAAAPAAGPGSSTWQSIFDVGEDNVRRTRPGSQTGERAKKTLT
jgi:hypothetical protein